MWNIVIMVGLLLACTGLIVNLFMHYDQRLLTPKERQFKRGMFVYLFSTYIIMALRELGWW